MPLSPERRHEPRRPKERSSEKRIIPSRHVHRRSKSMANIPIITIDYFGSTDTFNTRRLAGIPKTEPRIPEPVAGPLKPFPLPTNIPSSHTSSTCDSTANCGNDQAAPGFRLFGLKPWGKERSKRLERCQSSPQLCRSASLPQPSCHKQSSSDGVLTSPTKNEEKTKPPKPLRKMPSVPVQGKESEDIHLPSFIGRTFTVYHSEIGFKFDVSFRHAEKKRSQTLRTQPYDAPYFALPPVPPLPAYINKAPIHQEPSIPPSQSHPELDSRSSKSRIQHLI